MNCNVSIEQVITMMMMTVLFHAILLGMDEVIAQRSFKSKILVKENAVLYYCSSISTGVDCCELYSLVCKLELGIQMYYIYHIVQDLSIGIDLGNYWKRRFLLFKKQLRQSCFISRGTWTWGSM